SVGVGSGIRKPAPELFSIRIAIGGAIQSCPHPAAPVSLEAGMKQLIGVLALACAVCGAPLAAQPPAKTAQGTAKSGTAAGAPQGTTPGADAMFIRTAAMDGMAEVEHG